MKLTKIRTEKLHRMIAGEQVILSEEDCDWLSEYYGTVCNDLRTMYNPQRVGLLDKYIGSLHPTTDKSEAEKCTRS